MAKVAFLINSMDGGGAERVVSVLLKNLSRKDRELFLIVLEDKFNYDIPKDIKVIKLNSKYFGWRKLKSVVEENKINTVISFLGRSNYTNVLARSAGHKVYISERINPSQIHKKGLSGFINRTLIKNLYPKANLIFSNSLGGRNSLNQDFGISLDKIKVIYNPIDIEKIGNLCLNDLSEYQSIFNQPVIINVGSLNKYKNQAFLIKAFKRVLTQDKIKAKLLILGKGKLKGSLERLVRKLDLEKEVIFLGWQKNPFRFLSKSKVFVLSSITEGFPNVLIEAMACGIPAISTDCPSGPDEVIDNNENGILVPLKDGKALSYAISKILKDPTFAQKISENGKKRVQEFSVNNIIEQYEELI